ncbi:MAG: hypothetical protein EXR80_02990 [Methylococcales bacterium]|nr:hypothetical protein [Methylococcales bacterium]
MGPYSRGTTHGIGAVIETVYEHPILILLVVVVMVVLVLATALFIRYRKKSPKSWLFRILTHQI